MRSNLKSTFEKLEMDNPSELNKQVLKAAEEERRKELEEQVKELDEANGRKNTASQLSIDQSEM